jgi:hypothetical protein
MNALFLTSIAKVAATISRRSRRTMEKKNDRGGLMIALALLALFGLMLAMNL